MKGAVGQDLASHHPASTKSRQAQEFSKAGVHLQWMTNKLISKGCYVGIVAMKEHYKEAVRFLGGTTTRCCEVRR
jgi:hypothetical protein